jgi:hypothetical protein
MKFIYRVNSRLQFMRDVCHARYSPNGWTGRYFKV